MTQQSLQENPSKVRAPRNKQPSISEADLAVLVGSETEAQSLYKSPIYEPSFIFPYNPDPLCSGNSYDIYDEMMNDDQVKATIAMKKQAVVGTGWQIVCEDEEKKEFVEECLRNINADDPIDLTFEDVLKDMLSAYSHGFSLTEPVYGLNDDNLYVYKSLKTRPPHTFKFEIDKKGRVTNVVQSTDEGEKKFDPGLFLHHGYQVEYGNPYGKSDLSAAHGPWKAKKFMNKFFAIYMERFGMPTAIGKYKPGSDPAEIQRILTLLKRLQTSSTFVVPEDVMMEFLEVAKDSSDAYIKALNHYNMMIGRSILVPDLLGISGGKTEGGSFSLGQKQFEMFFGTIESDRKSLQRKITNKLVRPLVMYNFGKDIECKFEFKPFKDEDRIELIKIWAQIVGGKAFTPSDEEINHLRAISGFPEGEVERPEPAILGPDGLPIPGGAAPGMKPGMKPGDKMPDDEKGKGKETDDDKVKKPGSKGEFVEHAAPKLIHPISRDSRQVLAQYRQLTSYEGKIDFSMIEADLNAQESKVTKELMRAGRDIYSDIIDQIRARGILTKFKPELMNEIKPKFQKPMNAIFKAYMRDIFSSGVDDARKELLPNTPAKFSEALFPEDFQTVIDSESFKMTGDYSTQITNKARNLLAEGLKGNISEAELVALLREELKDNTERWIETVIRTKTTEVYNQARRSYWENDAIAKQMVVAYQFSAIIDSRTTEVCAHLDQQIFEVGDAVNRITPPLHFNCRSLLVPVTKFEEYDSEKVPTVDKIQDMGGKLKNFTGA